MSDEREENNQYISKLIKRLKPWRGCIACGILLLISVSVLFVTINDVKYPEERYNTYIDVKEDGFETVNFFFSSNIGSSLSKPIVIREAGMRLLSASHFRYGLYYKYSVVYRNGTILESMKEFLPFGVNRTLLDFNDIELSILQIFTGYGESPEGVHEELLTVMVSGFASLILVPILFALLIDADASSTSYRRRRRGWR
jgi:hypothetical protein